MAGNTSVATPTDDATVVVVASVAGAIDVTGNNQPVNNGDTSTVTMNNTDCGTSEVNTTTPLECMFNIINQTGAPVSVTGISVVDTGSSASLLQRMQQFSWWNVLGISNAMAVGFGDFSVATVTPFTINNNSSETFTISFTPLAAGLRDGVVVITFSDGSEFRFNISGNGTIATAAATNIPVFGPFGLLAMLAGLLWFGSRRKVKG